MERYRHWLALKQVAGVGNVLYKRLIDRFGTPEGVFQAGEKALLSVEGISPDTAREIGAFSHFKEVDRELEKIIKGGISLVSLHDPDYPSLLAVIYDPPPFLYVQGRCLQSEFFPMAIVGSRKPTHYGVTVAERFGREMAERGMTVVSGFARGIDAAAHRAVLAAGGRTIAVLGSGIDRIYPREHRSLFDEIAERGAVLSEFPMGAAPEAHHFPQRNRIIGGLSVGCLVVEATVESGSLITARLALEQGREVFAVPGSIFSETSRGTHRLIRSGAKLVEQIEDILEEIAPQWAKKQTESAAPIPSLEGEERKLYDLLQFDPKHIDQLIGESQLSAAAASSLLLSLELKGVVRQLDGKFYARI